MVQSRYQRFLRDSLGETIPPEFLGYYLACLLVVQTPYPTKNCDSSHVPLCRPKTKDLNLKPLTMVTPADLIRELTLTNKQLTKKNDNLKIENHNLRVTNDMLKNKAATDQAVMNAAITIENLATYNQGLEDENQHLREQLAFCAERKKIDEELEVLRKQAESIDEELEKRREEMKIFEKLDEQMKQLMQMNVQEAAHETIQDDALEAIQGVPHEDTQDSTQKGCSEEYSERC
jgi:hypothetical protein